MGVMIGRNVDKCTDGQYERAVHFELPIRLQLIPKMHCGTHWLMPFVPLTVFGSFRRIKLVRDSPQHIDSRNSKVSHHFPSKIPRQKYVNVPK